MRIRKHGGLVDVDKTGKVIITPFAGQQVDITGDVDISGAITKDGVAILAGLDAMVYKGVIDCSANPNYPAANAGDTYKISIAGKIGGALGESVQAGDFAICNTDGTLAGTEAQRGTAWDVVQTNIEGAVVGPTSATADAFTQFDGTTGKLVKSGVTLDTDVALAGNSDIRLASQKAVKAYVDATAIPGGSDTQVQFNDGGVFGGLPSLLADTVSTNVFGNSQFAMLHVRPTVSDDPSAVLYAAAVDLTISPTANSDSEYAAFSSRALVPVGNAFDFSDSIYGANSSAFFFGDGDIYSVWGVYTEANKSGPGTADQVVGMHSRPSAGNGGISGQATLVVGFDALVMGLANGTVISEAAGVRVQTPFKTGTATITTNYGVKVEDQSTASATSFNIFSAGAASKNKFEGLLELSEISDPAAPAANNTRLYCRDNGSGKTQIVAVFPTGVVQVIATEP